jgi:hypothetical protein
MGSAKVIVPLIADVGRNHSCKSRSDAELTQLGHDTARRTSLMKINVSVPTSSHAAPRAASSSGRTAHPSANTARVAHCRLHSRRQGSTDISSNRLRDRCYRFAISAWRASIVR